jgi:hypothetical protein
MLPEKIECVIQRNTTKRVGLDVGALKEDLHFLS